MRFCIRTYACSASDGEATHPFVALAWHVAGRRWVKCIKGRVPVDLKYCGQQKAVNVVKGEGEDEYIFLGGEELVSRQVDVVSQMPESG